jgi:hypothetical protein
LLIWRYVSYTAQKYQYFLLDYCYWVNILCFLHLFAAPDNPTYGVSAALGGCLSLVSPFPAQVVSTGLHVCQWPLGVGDHGMA